MTDSQVLSFDEIETLALDALVSAGTSIENALPLAKATAQTEADGIASHGLAYIPTYCEHVQCGKVDGLAEPVLEQPAPAIITVDAKCGFAHTAIRLGFDTLIPVARDQGIAALAISNSYNCGVLGYHTRALAEAGLLGIGFTNAPASIAPVGARIPVVGTNPFSIAVPDGSGGASLLIDQSASVIAKSEILKRGREGLTIPEGWALDSDGNPTTDPEIALKGSMSPSGGYKGVGVALMVEIFAAAMTGASLGIHASPFSGTKGGPPKTGQFFMAINPDVTSSGLFKDRISALVSEIREQPGARLPGDGRNAANRRAQKKGIKVSSATLEKVRALL